MIAPAKAGKFTLYRGERQGLAAERAVAAPQTLWRGGLPPLGCAAAPKYPATSQNLWRGSLLPLDCEAVAKTKPLGTTDKTGLQVFGATPQPNGSKLPRHKSHSTLFRRPSPQPPPNHIQHITPIAQWNSAEQGKVAENEGLTLDRTAHGHILKHLSDGANSIVGSVIQNIERRVGIDEQRGHVGAVAGKGHEAVFGVGDYFFVGWIGG
ncbi:hypothetical protein ACS73_08435 [Pseudomonas lini]|nr:hypothetical protein ACS73_08435 [Pseudomonas lini]